MLKEGGRGGGGAKKLLQLWPHFKLVTLGISLDSIGAMNDYIRHPSKWDKVQKNLSKVNKIASEPKSKVVCWYAVTIQMYNVWYIPEFVKWKVQNEYTFINRPNLTRSFFNFHVLHNPKHLNIRALPLPIKLKIKKRYEDLLLWVKDFLDSQDMEEGRKARKLKMLEEDLNGIVEYMMLEDWSDKLLPKFWKLTKGLDQMRGESFSDVFPEFYEELKDHLNS